MKNLLVVDIGGTHIKFLAIQDGQQRELQTHVPTSVLRSADPVGSLAALIGQARTDLQATPDAVVSTVPGFVHPDLDLIQHAGNVPELNGHRLASELSARLGCEVRLERDSVLLLQGEWRAGAGRGARNLLGLFFGTGVGAAFLQDGVPFRGAGYALEIGSMPFRGYRAHGLPLAGLRSNCLETHVSGRVLAEIARSHAVPIAEVFQRAAGNAALARDVDGFLGDMAMTAAMAVWLFSPDTTVIGGGICAMAGFPRSAFARAFDRIAPGIEIGGQHRLAWAELGWQAVAAGAWGAPLPTAPAENKGASPPASEEEKA